MPECLVDGWPCDDYSLGLAFFVRLSGAPDKTDRFPGLEDYSFQ
jgi:hypothetical protein